MHQLESGWRPLAATRRARVNRASGTSGMVSAEMAICIPALVGVVALLLSALWLAAAQVVLLQAACEGARAAARGDSTGQVSALVRRRVPASEVAVTTSSGEVTVALRVRPSSRLPLASRFAPELTAESTATAEEASLGDF